MIIIKLMGGLGNQMFQYAFGKSLSLRTGEDVHYDTSFYLNKKIKSFEKKIGINRRLALHHFNLCLNEKSKFPRIKRYWYGGLNKIHTCIPRLSKITNYMVFDETSLEPNQLFPSEYLDCNIHKKYFIGYWQSEKYFVKYRDEILRDFQIITPQSKKNMSWSERIMDCNSVSLHVRRGDFSPEWFLDAGYYSRAIEYISKHVDTPVFFLFSDDMQWVKKNLTIPYEVYYMNQNEQAEAYEDLRLMSQCKYNIIANSTFSWWGAWLNQNPNKIVVAPNYWVQELNHNNKIIPEDWVKL